MDADRSVQRADLVERAVGATLIGVVGMAVGGWMVGYQLGKLDPSMAFLVGGWIVGAVSMALVIAGAISFVLTPVLAPD